MVRCQHLLPWILIAPMLLPLASAQADTGEMPGTEVAELRQQLKNGLRARLPSQLRFIDQVVELVDAGRLPIALVKSTFQWAREKAQTKAHPFPYFERALRLRARKLGIRF